MEVANIYDNGPISPICKIKENLALYLGPGAGYKPYRVDYIEPIPASSPFIVDMVALQIAGGGAVTIPANGQVAHRLVNALQQNEQDLLHLRWEPLDDMEGSLFELASAPRFQVKGGQARVTPFTREYDPWLATTTFWILGELNKDVNIAANNPQGVAQPTARFQFFGYRYVVTELEGTEKAAAFGRSITYLPIQAWG